MGEMLRVDVTVSELGLKRLALRRLRQVLLLLDDENPTELGQAFELIGAAESAIDQLLQRTEDSDG